ncbi:MAG: nucleoside-triphosphatase THEP1 [Oleiphilaceae bacterium]|jgi:nucleoside-triphosphatase THEP1
MTIKKKKLQVTVAKAQYRETKVEAYQNNPLILALPNRVEANRFKHALSKSVIPRDVCHLSDGDRVGYIKDLRKTRIITTEHLDLYNEIYDALSHGYVDRNPNRPEVVAWSYDIADNTIPLDDIDMPHLDALSAQTTADNLFITGFSGNGKSTITELMLMKLLPMAIDQHHWKGFDEPQVVFIKVDMPDNASRAALIYQILQELERILAKTSFGKANYAKACKTKSGSYRSIAEMEDILFTALNRHHVGLLIIDEFQNLQVASLLFRAEMLQFFDALSNQLTIPNIKIGTPDTILLFDTKGRHKRRIGLILEIMRFAGKKDWDRAMKAIFGFQPINRPIERNEKVEALLKDLTAGVPSILMALWEGCLIEAVKTGSETITQTLIKRVFKKRFPLMRSVTRNINKGTKGRHADLLTVQQYLDSGDKPLALKHLQHFTNSAQVKGATASAVVEDINAMVEQQNFSSSDLKKLDKIKNELKGKSQGEKLPQTLEHEE